MTFTSFLRLEDDADDEAKSSALTAIITSAVHDRAPEISLSEVYSQVGQDGGSEYLDALHVLPVLLQSEEPAARDLISLVAECSSAKEVAIAAQEVLERLRPRFEEDEEDSALSAVKTIIQLVEVYVAVIPRIKLRKKSAIDTVRPYLTEIQEAIGLAGHFLSTEQSRMLLLLTSHLVKRTYKWIEEKDPTTDDAKPALQGLLLHSISATSQRLDEGLAQRTFENLYPRLVVRPRVSSSQTADEAVVAANNAYKLLGNTVSDAVRIPSPSAVFLVAHCDTEDLSDPKVLRSVLPVLVACIQSNTVVDQALAFLLRIVHHNTSELPTDALIPLMTVLPALASGHPDAQTRHQVFRIIGLLLSRSPSPLRLQFLQELTSDADLPQMRVAAVGLVKEAVLESLGSPASNNNIFAAPAFLRTFGPILFRPSPANLFDSLLSIKDFEESHESKRLVECLSLYYILLIRDQNNLTGVRDADVARSLDHTLLVPLRKQLEIWHKEADSSGGHIHDLMPLVSLQMSLDRVDTARNNLNPASPRQM